MSTPLPDALTRLATRPLFVMRLTVAPLLKAEETPAGRRRVGVVTGGTFAGERLGGSVLDGGADWQTVRPDRATTLDVRLVLRTEAGSLVFMTYRGLRHGPSEVLERLERGEAVKPEDYYFRMTPSFETTDPKLDWLNRIVAVGTGHRLPDGPVYSVFEVL